MEACGISNISEAYTREEILSGVSALRSASSCAALVVYVNQGSRPDLGRPTISPEENKKNMMALFWPDERLSL